MSRKSERYIIVSKPFFCLIKMIRTVERGNIEQVINFKVKLKILGDVL
jgi:hypothetical protein